MDKTKIEAKVTINLAKEEDIPAIANLIKELAIFEKEPEAVIVTPEILLDDWRKGLFHLFVAHLEEEIIGMALYYTAYSSWRGRMLYLDDLIVTEKHRGIGAGALLLDKVMEEGIRLKARVVKWQVLDWNTPAIDFYEKRGATIERNWWNVKVLT